MVTKRVINASNSWPSSYGIRFSFSPINSICLVFRDAGPDLVGLELWVPWPSYGGREVTRR